MLLLLLLVVVKSINLHADASDQALTATGQAKLSKVRAPRSDRAPEPSVSSHEFQSDFKPSGLTDHIPSGNISFNAASLRIQKEKEEKEKEMEVLRQKIRAAKAQKEQKRKRELKANIAKTTSKRALLAQKLQAPSALSQQKPATRKRKKTVNKHLTEPEETQSPSPGIFSQSRMKKRKMSTKPQPRPKTSQSRSPHVHTEPSRSLKMASKRSRRRSKGIRTPTTAPPKKPSAPAHTPTTVVVDETESPDSKELILVTNYLPSDLKGVPMNTPVVQTLTEDGQSVTVIRVVKQKRKKMPGEQSLAYRLRDTIARVKKLASFSPPPFTNLERLGTLLDQVSPLGIAIAPHTC